MILKVANTGYSSQPYQKNKANIAFGDSLGIIKPEAYHLKNFAFKEIEKAGFKVECRKTTKLSKETIEQHYAGLRKLAQEKLEAGNDFLMKVYNRVVENMQKGNVVTFVVKGDEAETARFKNFVGATLYQKRSPDSLRAMIESKEAARLTKEGKTIDEITKFREEFSFVHASDTDYFEGNSGIKNYDREILIHYPNKKTSK